MAACSRVEGGNNGGHVRRPLPPSSSSPTVAGCRLGGFPVGRDLWGGERVVGGVLPRINIGTNV